jgi:hypothetical protein
VTYLSLPFIALTRIHQTRKGVHVNLLSELTEHFRSQIFGRQAAPIFFQTLVSSFRQDSNAQTYKCFESSL